jgi:hypothetical protein
MTTMPVHDVATSYEEWGTRAIVAAFALLGLLTTIGIAAIS